MGPYEVYIHAFYFVVTTMTTVGYGDMSANTTVERIFCIVLMVLGVIVFTFISGALSSVLSNFDSSTAAAAEQQLYVNKLKIAYSIDDTLYNKIYNHGRKNVNNAEAGLDYFVEALPYDLRLSVTLCMYSELFKMHVLF